MPGIVSLLIVSPAAHRSLHGPAVVAVLGAAFGAGIIWGPVQALLQRGKALWLGCPRDEVKDLVQQRVLLQVYL